MSLIINQEVRKETGMREGFREEVGQRLTAGHTAYCLHCRAVTFLSADIVISSVSGPDGNDEITAERVYHCERCHCFVSSERIFELCP